MDLQLKGKIALVTGASKGIGLACAKALAREGCTLALVARSAEALQAAAREVAATPGEAHCFPADLSSLSGVRSMVAGVREALGRIDVLVNNAGGIRAGAFLEIPDEQWLEDWNLTLLGYIRAAREVFPLMASQGGGCIINVVGTGGRQVSASYLVGGAANAALINFTKGLSELGARHRIFVKAASPAAVQTERWERRIQLEAEAEGLDPAALRAGRIAEFPLGRIVTPDEVGDLVAFLASPRSDMLHGGTVTIDGGWTRGVYP
jgi:3-oxoacyl-[acyl-carrier protein] reductase